MSFTNIILLNPHKWETIIISIVQTKKINSLLPLFPLLFAMKWVLFIVRYFPLRVSVQFSSVQSLSCVQLFVTPWIAAHQASLWEKAMAPHSSTLAWKILWTEEPGRLQSMGSLIVGHNWVTSLSLFTFIHWRRKWQPTPVFLPGESQGRGSLVGCRLWGRTESDTTET